MWQLELLDEAIEEIRDIARFYSETDGQPSVDRFLDQIDDVFKKLEKGHIRCVSKEKASDMFG